MAIPTDIKVIAFDADDTLWDCQSWFDEVERKCCEMLKPWATAREVSEGLFATEHRNLPLTGYGTKAFTLSLIENAIRISKGELTGDKVMQLIDMGKELLRFPTTPLSEVKETLEVLSQTRRYRYSGRTKERPSSRVLGRYLSINSCENRNMCDMAMFGFPSGVNRMLAPVINR